MFKKSFVLSFSILLIFLAVSFAQHEEDISEFLKPTNFINGDHPEIIARAREVTIGCKTDAEKAKALFEFVIDSYNNNECKSFVASDILKCGGNSCRKRSILLTALCRAVGIPARLHLQKVTIKDWNKESGEVGDIIFIHGITGIYLNGEWHLYESVGNRDKWISWTRDEKRGAEMPVKFYPDCDCLFKPDEKIIIETLPIYFADWTKEIEELIEKTDKF